jgi:hypothetical protein
MYEMVRILCMADYNDGALRSAPYFKIICTKTFMMRRGVRRVSHTGYGDTEMQLISFLIVVCVDYSRSIYLLVIRK